MNDFPTCRVCRITLDSWAAALRSRWFVALDEQLCPGCFEELAADAAIYVEASRADLQLRSRDA